MSLRAGDWVEVRSREEILATLDRRGGLGKLPFMPQMFSYCGQRFRVLKNAHKSCDTVSGRYTGLALEDTVHLEHRCDGAAFGGCQAGCLLFWKEAWLKPIDPLRTSQASPLTSAATVTPLGASGRCTESDVHAATRTMTPEGETIYSCQATRLLEYAKPLKWWDARQYVETYRSGNTTLRELVRGLTYLVFTYGTGAHRSGWGRPFRWLYDLARPLHGGGPFPRQSGTVSPGTKAPRHDLALQPGELVQVKSFDEILRTIDKTGSNRGLAFDAELVPYCGKTFRVLTRVERFVDERTGRMKTLKTPAVILDGVVCRARYAGQRMFCPRAIHLWWREIWLCRQGQSGAGA